MTTAVLVGAALGLAFLLASVAAWLLVRSGNSRLDERYDEDHPSMRPEDWPWDDAS